MPAAPLGNELTPFDLHPVFVKGNSTEGDSERQAIERSTGAVDAPNSDSTLSGSEVLSNSAAFPWRCPPIVPPSVDRKSGNACSVPSEAHGDSSTNSPCEGRLTAPDPPLLSSGNHPTGTRKC